MVPMSLYNRVVLSEAKKGPSPNKEWRQPTKAELAKGTRPADVKWADWFKALKLHGKKGKKKASKGTAKPAKPSPKPKGVSPLANMNPAFVSQQKKRAKKGKVPKLVRDAVTKWAASRSYVRKNTWLDVLKKSVAKGKVSAVADWVREIGPLGWLILKDKGLGYFLQVKPTGDQASQHWTGGTQQMGWWGVGGKKKSSKGGSSSGLPKVEDPTKKKLRTLRHSLGKIERMAAGGVVFKSFTAPSVEEMLVLVSQVHPKYGSYWVFPKGGVDLGETLHQGAAREVREEAGVKAKVVPGSPYVHTSTFGERGKYDLPLVMDLLLKKHPADKEFIKQHEEALSYAHFTYKNVSHYYVMKHTGGRPRQNPGKDQEMNKSEWVTLAEAAKRSARMKAVIKGLLPQIKTLWKEGPAPTGTSLRDLAGTGRR